MGKIWGNFVSEQVYYAPKRETIVCHVGITVCSLKEVLKST